MMKIAIVPAKNRSKRCKDKNWKPFGVYDESLVELMTHKIYGSKIFDKLLVSIDFSPKNFGSSDKYQCIRRPRTLREMSSADVCLHALDEIDAKDTDEYYFMQCTTPFIGLEEVTKCVKHAPAGKVITVNPSLNPNGGCYAGPVGLLRQIPDFFTPLHKIVMSNWFCSFDIDTEYQFQIGRLMYADVLSTAHKILIEEAEELDKKSKVGYA